MRNCFQQGRFAIKRKIRMYFLRYYYMGFRIFRLLFQAKNWRRNFFGHVNTLKYIYNKNICRVLLTMFPQKFVKTKLFFPSAIVPSSFLLTRE